MDLYEFDLNYVFNPEDTSITGSGSGVHLFEDVTLTFDIIDREGSSLGDSVSINKNPFIGDMKISILNTGSDIIYPNFYSGAALRSFTLTKQENIDIFGYYEKDFGILVDIQDKTAGRFDSIFQLRGNIPLINYYSVKDGFGLYETGNPFGTLRLTFSWPPTERLYSSITFLGQTTYDTNAFQDALCNCPQDVVFVDFGLNGSGNTSGGYGSHQLNYQSSYHSGDLCIYTWTTSGVALTTQVNHSGDIVNMSLDNTIINLGQWTSSSEVSLQTINLKTNNAINGTFDDWSSNPFSSRSFGVYNEDKFSLIEEDRYLSVTNSAPTAIQLLFGTTNGFKKDATYRFKTTGIHRYTPAGGIADAEYLRSAAGVWNTTGTPNGQPTIVANSSTLLSSVGAPSSAKIITNWGPFSSNNTYRAEYKSTGDQNLYSYVWDSDYTDNQEIATGKHYISVWQRFPRVYATGSNTSPYITGIDPYTTLSIGSGSSYKEGPFIFETDLARAWTENAITDHADITCRSEWYSTGAQPATLKIEYIKNETETYEIPIYPGNECPAETVVANLKITENGVTGFNQQIITGSIFVDLTFENDPNYIKYSHIDVFNSTESGVDPIEENFYKRIPIFYQTQRLDFNIKADDIEYNVPYYFRLIPYSQLGSGVHIIIGPHIIIPSPKIPSLLEAENLIINEDGDSVIVDLITGRINSSLAAVIDTVAINSFYSIEYMAKMTNSSGEVSSSQIALTITDPSGTGYSFFEYAISANSTINYSVTGDSQNVYLKAQTDTPPVTYKLHKTSI
jgi:hypothetical protein